MYTLSNGFLLRDITYTSFLFIIPKFTTIHITMVDEDRSMVNFKYKQNPYSAWINNEDIALDTRSVLP